MTGMMASGSQGLMGFLFPPASPKAKPPPDEDDPPIRPRGGGGAKPRGRSVLQKADARLPQRHRSALERLDGYDKDKRGRISLEAMGLRRARATEAAELAEARKVSERMGRDIRNARGIDTSRVDLRVDPHTRARARPEVTA